MNLQSQLSPELLEVIYANKQAIFSNWTHGVVEACKPHLYMDESQVVTLIQEYLSDFREIPEGESKDKVTVCFYDLAERLKKPSLFIKAIDVLKGSITAMVETKTSLATDIFIKQLNKCIDEQTALVLDTLFYRLKKSLDEANSRIALLNYIVGITANSLNLSEILTQAGSAIAAAAGANDCFFYLYDNEELMVFVPEMHPGYKTWYVPGCNPVKIPRDSLSPTDALWQVLKDKEVISIFDAQTAPNTTHSEELRKSGIKSFLLVPCLSKGNVVAIAVVHTFKEHKDFTPEEIEASQAFASVVAPAIENALLHQKVEQLAALEERARIARAMHDSLAQTLGALQLKASQTGDLLDKAKVDAARKNIDELSQIARDAYTDVREAIFNLRVRTPWGKDFVPYLQDYLSTYQACFGIRISLETKEDITDGLSSENADQIMYIIQEALTNVRKHAGATHVHVTLKKVKNMLHVEITDNGIGFDLEHFNREVPIRHLGLQIMKERAALTGGRLEVESHPGLGTRLHVFIPINEIPTLSL